MSFFEEQSASSEPMDLRQVQQVALEKIRYMHGFAKTSTPATVIAPLLCIPLFDSVDLGNNFHIWLGLMAVAVLIRIFLVRSIRLDDDANKNFVKLNWAVGIVTSVWGLGWLMLVPGMDPVNYLIYQVISLTVLFVGMVGYCVHWQTFFSFALPLKITELLFIIVHSQFIIWPIAIGSLVNFYLALKMGFFFPSLGKSRLRCDSKTRSCSTNWCKKRMSLSPRTSPNQNSSPPPATTFASRCKPSTSSLNCST